MWCRRWTHCRRSVVRCRTGWAWSTLLLAAAADGRSFGELAAATVVPAVARAFLLHLLWHRRLGMDLSQPLTDRTPIMLAAGALRGAG